MVLTEDDLQSFVISLPGGWRASRAQIGPLCTAQSDHLAVSPPAQIGGSARGYHEPLTSLAA
jgi:hypothetical protein